MPEHIAIIMDGNGRWAKAKGLPRLVGHKSGLEAVRRVVKACAHQKIPILSLFAFSSENWKRPPEEVQLLLRLMLTAIQKEVKELHQHNIQVQFIGDRQSLSEKLQRAMLSAETLTKANTGMRLVVAVNYGGRWDFLQAAWRLSQTAGVTDFSDFCDSLPSYLSTALLPEPDLLIRTSGEQRISNFYLWQLAYSEIYFSDVYWPDFSALELQAALQWFAGRERRFGQTPEQLEVG